MLTPQTSQDHCINPELLKIARDNMRRKFPGLQKAAFIPGGDPSMTGAPPGGGGGPPPPGGGMPPPPGGDPSGGGGMPPPPGGDPSGGGGMPPGMDPSMMGGGGGGPPPPPSGGGGGDPTMMMLQQILQAIQGGGGGAAGSMQSGANQAGQLKPKIDVNVAIMQMSKMIARIADALGVKIPASEMIATPNDLTSMANKQQAGGQQDASMGGAPGGIPPMPGMPDMSSGPGKTAGDRRRDPNAGVAYDHTGLDETMNKAAAIMRLRKQRRVA